jgi:uncharacterized protein
MNRRQFVKRGMLGAAALAAVEGFVREPRHPVGEEVEIRLRRLPEAFDGFRIAQISDIHFGPFMGKEGMERGVEVAKGLRPDFVVLTGDFVSHSIGKAHGIDGAHHAEPCADVLVQWKNMPMLAILGNHDHWNGADIVAGALTERGIRVLRNEATALERGGARLWIAGVDDPLVQAADMQKTLAGIPGSEATVLLAHEPDFADYAAKFPVDLQLSGHSHGGQVRIPGIGPIVLPDMATKYHTGLNRVGQLQVYTNWGLGMITPPVRFLCPPKVTVFVLRRDV